VHIRHFTEVLAITCVLSAPIARQAGAQQGAACDTASRVSTTIRDVPVYAFLAGETGKRSIPGHYGELILQAVAEKFMLPENLVDQPWTEANSLLSEHGMRTDRRTYALVRSFDAEIGFLLHRNGSVTDFRATVPKPSSLEIALIGAMVEAGKAGLMPVLLDDVRGDEVPLRLRLGTGGRDAIARREVARVDVAVELGQAVLPFSSNPKPRFPEHMQMAGYGGEVVVQFVVNEDGRPELSTYRVLSYSDVSLAVEVTKVVPRLRFKPAWVAGCRVRQLVQVPFAFNIVR
jgi:TonB family protein